MKSFKTYLEETQRNFEFRIKMVVPPTDTHMDDIERLLRRYNLISIGTPQQIDPKTDAMEFRDIENADVWYVDVVIGVPFSAYILQQELRAALNVPEKFLVVRSDNEPIEIESQKLQILNMLDKLADEKGLRQKASLLSTDPHYLDAEQPVVKDVFGDKYNKSFLNYLAAVASKRKPTEFDTISSHISVKDLKTAQRTQTPDVADFNSEFDTPKPISKPRGKAEFPIASEVLTSSGNFDDDSKTYFTPRRNRAGKTVALSSQASGVRSTGKTSQ
jgi:hypothetical protein